MLLLLLLGDGLCFRGGHGHLVLSGLRLSGLDRALGVGHLLLLLLGVQQVAGLMRGHLWGLLGLVGGSGLSLSLD